MIRGLLIGAIALLITACEPAAGSYEWCERVAHADKSDWSDAERQQFTDSCVPE